MADMKLHEAVKSTTTTKQKERHIVTWTQQEDDILREHISIHGTENWATIAAKFKDKTTRQCRRRWYTYLNSDFKKGGWSPEEDMILCEAQRIFGNRWTQIAKVVPGRTDNAVKNRFSTLCKKQAKHEALSEENSASINSNTKRVMLQNGFITNGTSESAPSLKKMRTYITDFTENCNLNGRLHRECGEMENQRLRSPFAELVQNSHNVSDLPAQQPINSTSTASNDVANNRVQETFLKRDDPKITALMQQAELLSSLAVKVNTDNNNQSLENVWTELQHFLNQTNKSERLGYKISETDFSLEDLKDLVKDLKSNMSPLCWRQPDLYESPGSSEYSTGSTLQYHIVGEKTEQLQAEVCSLHQDTSVGLQSNLIFLDKADGVSEDGFTGTSVPAVGLQSIHMEVENNGCGGAYGSHTNTNVTQVSLPSCDEHIVSEGVISSLPNTEFNSPLQVTPVFRAIAAMIPSPKFSESERHFLLKTLGSGSPSPNPSQPPTCRRALLHSL